MTTHVTADDLRRHMPGLLALTAAGMLLGAYGFQYIGGLDPCVLCLYQRVPHAAVVLIGALGWYWRDRGPWNRYLTGLACLVLLIGAGIAAFHVGVEQKWWEGTSSCGASNQPTTLEELRAQIMAQPIVRCDEVAWSLFGISMAAYNMLISTGLAGIGFWSIRRAATDGAPQS